MIVFIDDILVYSKSDADHIDHLHLVLQTLKDQSLYTKFSKCEFWLNIVTYMGLVFSSKGIIVVRRKLQWLKSGLGPWFQSIVEVSWV